jgi:hypothetical protein
MDLSAARCFSWGHCLLILLYWGGITFCCHSCLPFRFTRRREMCFTVRKHSAHATFTSWRICSSTSPATTREGDSPALLQAVSRSSGIHHTTHPAANLINSNYQCCGAENISFGSDSGSAEPQIRIAGLTLAPAPNKFCKIRVPVPWELPFLAGASVVLLYLIRIKIVAIYKNFVSNHDFFSINFLTSVINRKEPEPEPQFAILAPRPGENLISAPWLRLPKIPTQELSTKKSDVVTMGLAEFRWCGVAKLVGCRLP